MTIAPISAIGQIAQIAAPTATQATTATNAANFGDALAGALDQVNAAQNSADSLATKAATGDLTDVHDYMIAATEASLSTEMTVAIRDKAVDAFNQIMGMPV